MRPEEYYRAIIDRIGDPVFVKDQEHRYVFVNDAACGMFGILRDQALGKTDDDLFTKEQADVFGEHDNYVLETGEMHIHEHQVTDAQGRVRTVVAKKTLYISETGEKQVVGTLRDVTVRKKAESAASATERKLRTIVDNLPDGIARFDEECRYIFVNPTVATTVGVPPEYFLGKKITEADSHEEDGAQNLAIEGVVRKVFKEGLSNRIETRWKTDDGFRFFDVLHVPEKDENGKIVSVLGIARDITERKRAEETLSLLNRELRAITDCNQILLRAVDEQTLLTDICRIICDEAGYAMAWVGYAGRDAAKTVRPVAWAGVENGYLEDAGITWAATERGQGPAARAIRNGEMSYIQDFADDPRIALWREKALQRGHRSCIAFPLKDEGANTFGALVIYSAKPNAFIPGEVRLLEELSGDLAFGIAVQRARAERKRSEEALRLSEFRLTEAMNLAHLVHWEADPASSMFIFNDPFYALYGTTAEREGGYRMASEDYVRRFMHPEDQHLFHEIVAQNTARLERESFSDFEHRIIRRDGAVRHVLVRTKIARDESGRITARYGTNQDITERKLAEAELKLNESRLEALLKLNQMTHAGIAEIAGFALEEAVRLTQSRIGYVAFVNKDETVLTMHAWSAAAMKECGIQDKPKVYPVAETGLWGEAIRQRRPVVTNDYAAPNLLVRGLPRGHVAVTKHMNVPVFDGNKIVMVAGVGNKETDYNESDIAQLTLVMNGVWSMAQRKQSEEERMRLESQLFQAQKMEAVGTLAGGIAHDFNNILTALVGYAALLRMKMSDSSLCTYVDQILSASQKATGLIQSLLAFSKQQAVSLKPISIHGIIRGTEDLLKRLLTEDIVIKTVLADEDMTVMGDATQIDQILFNLTTNARDAMPRGGTLTIETKMVELGDEFERFYGYGEPGRYARLTIADTGVGMDEATRERIFDPFFSTKEVGKGTGLGLSTVYGIVRQHNGYITVYSEPGRGTVFHIYLPIVRTIDREEEQEQTPVKGGSETVLIAEDNEAVRGLISEILTQHGYTTISAEDGSDAVKRLKKAGPIDLLILDSVMPNQNGREAYNEIAGIDPHVKVIFTSGYTRDVFLDKGIEDKKFSFLQKPISPAALLQKVREVLDEKQGGAQQSK